MDVSFLINMALDTYQNLFFDLVVYMNSIYTYDYILDKNHI